MKYILIKNNYHFINEEKIKKANDYFNYNNEILKGLEETKNVYLMKIKTIKEAIKNGDSSEQLISPEDIEKYAQRLYDLKINGEALRDIKNLAINSQASVVSNASNTKSKGKFVGKHTANTNPNRSFWKWGK